MEWDEVNRPANLNETLKLGERDPREGRDASRSSAWSLSHGKPLANAVCFEQDLMDTANTLTFRPDDEEARQP